MSIQSQSSLPRAILTLHRYVAYYLVHCLSRPLSFRLARTLEGERVEYNLLTAIPVRPVPRGLGVLTPDTAIYGTLNTYEPRPHNPIRQQWDA